MVARYSVNVNLRTQSERVFSMHTLRIRRMVRGRFHPWRRGKKVVTGRNTHPARL